MALRIPWDIEESVLMLDTLLKSLDGLFTRKEAIRRVSEKLRQRAINKGIEIDDIFRNENGIAFQMSAMEVAYTGIETKLKQPTKLFIETVNLYRNHREDYEKILREAEDMTDSKALRDAFYTYLSAQAPAFQQQEVFSMLADIESFCLKRSILKEHLFETTEMNIINQVVRTVDSNRVFRFTYKRSLKKMSAVIHAYYAFLKSTSEVKKVQPTIHAAELSTGNSDDTDIEISHSITDESAIRKRNVIELLDLESPIFEDERQKFNEWMKKTGMADTTITNYMSAFGQCVRSVKGYKLCDIDLWNITNVENVRTLYDQLFGIREFYEYNRQQHNRFSAAFRKYIEFRSEENTVEVQPLQSQVFHTVAIETKDGLTENDPVLTRYKELLKMFFPKGFWMDSSLEMKKLRKFYHEQYEAELTAADALVYQTIRGMTILHEGKAYLPDLMLSPEKKEKLQRYIADKLSSDCDAIYYAALFSEWEEEFHGERIYSPAMLKTYLSYINHGDYVIQRSYIAKDFTVQINPEDEVREYLKEAGEPVEVTQIFEALSYIPEQKIKQVLSMQNDFIWNSTGVYFHESYFNLSNSELGWILQFVEDGIEDRNFITGNELVEAVEVHFPDIKEMYQQITMVGKRNAIAYKLRDRFSFNGNIISRYGERLSMANVYSKFCQKHSRFTLDELNVLKQELNSTIYFDEVYANSLRVSQNEFVAVDMVQFDVAATDEAIERFCTGQYMPIQAVQDFGTFPYAGYPWNEFLLEHFVANYSQKFMLLHIGYNANLCAGAIVKQTSSFQNFNELLIDILANSDVVLDESVALEYLCQKGYIGRRRYSDIGKILAEAKVVRSKKG